MVIHATFQDFLLFLYVHIAHVDNTYDPKELEAIKIKMARLFPEGTDLEQKLYRAIREYNAFDRTKISQLCKDSFAYFNSHETGQHETFFTDAQAIINADGTILPAETDALQALKKMIEQHE